MPLPKEWKFKPTVVAYPYSYEDTIVCHNCYASWSKEIINPCTGLCKTCLEENPMQIQEIRGRCPGDQNCRKCFQVLKLTNFGICRDVCASCKADKHPLKQRCLSCDKYDDSCWNNICISCRSARLLICEHIGYFYRDWKHHNKSCWWCVNYK